MSWCSYRDHGPADARRDAPQRLAEKREPDAMQNTGGPGISTFATNQVEPGGPKPRQNMMPGVIEKAI
jgi:hypothetical protein